MAKEFDNNFTGILFVNDKKQEEKQPDYTGSAEVNRIKYFLSGWKRKTKAEGKTFLSLAFTEKEKTPGADRRPAPQPAHSSDVEF